MRTVKRFSSLCTAFVLVCALCFEAAGGIVGATTFSPVQPSVFLKTLGTQPPGAEGQIGASIAPDGSAIVYLTRGINPISNSTEIRMYVSAASNGALVGDPQLVTRENADGTVSELVTMGASITRGGRYVFYGSTDAACTTLCSQRLIRFDRQTGAHVTLALRDASGANANGGAVSVGSSSVVAVSDDGRFAAYTQRTRFTDRSSAFLMDVENDTVRQVDVPSPGTNPNNCPVAGQSTSPMISGNGRWVTFATTACLVPEDTDNVQQFYLYDAATESIERVSSLYGNGQDKSATVSNDGRFVAYGANANPSSPETSGSFQQLVIWDRQNNTREVVASPTNTAANSQEQIWYPSASRSGDYVTFISNATRFTNPNVSLRLPRLYRYDIANQSIELISVLPGGTAPSNSAHAQGNARAFTEDDRIAVFGSFESLQQQAWGLYRWPASVDTLPPQVTGAPAEGSADDWFNHDVMINWTATDPDSSQPPTIPAPTLANIEGENTYTSDPSCDAAGNCATGSLAIKIDKTAPTLGLPAWSANPKATTAVSTITIPATDGASGVLRGEYFVGGMDPGLGNALPLMWDGSNFSADFGADLTPGVYAVTVRAQDAAGNWSTNVTDYLVVYNPSSPRISGKKSIVPSLSNGDVLPGLIDTEQTDKATFGFNVKYNDQGVVAGDSDFQFMYETGKRCNKPGQGENCHSLALNATSIAWLAIQGENDSTGVFQGSASMVVDGIGSSVVFRVTGVDGERLDPITLDRFEVKIYPEGANPNTAAPIYRINLTDILGGNIRITE